MFEHFLEEYKAGRTPNPDILCNREIKFKVFLDYANQLNCDYIATGHYARLSTQDNQTRLLKGLDNNKDQSYFLHAVNEAAFARSLFPIGEMDKPDVRKLAEQYDLVTHNKKDSTGICFIGERRFKEFLQRYLPAQPGDIINDSGDIIGQHDGLMYHTIGQRQGLGTPWYVARKDLTHNQLLVVQGTNHPLLFSPSLNATNVHWINSEPAFPFNCYAKTRYRQTDQACTITKTSHDELNVVFKEPQRAVTAGQSVVFYQNHHCLGGAVINHTESSTHH